MRRFDTKQLYTIKFTTTLSDKIKTTQLVPSWQHRIDNLVALCLLIYERHWLRCRQAQ